MIREGITKDFLGNEIIIPQCFWAKDTSNLPFEYYLTVLNQHCEKSFNTCVKLRGWSFARENNTKKLSVDQGNATENLEKSTESPLKATKIRNCSASR